MIRWYWEPKEDITLHELAVALGVLLPLAADSSRERADDLVGRLPSKVIRHFVKAESARK